MFSTFGYTHESNTAGLVKKKRFKLCFDLTCFQIVAILGLFATLPSARRPFTGQCEGKECVRVVKAHSEEAEWCPWWPSSNTATFEKIDSLMRCL